MKRDVLAVHVHESIATNDHLTTGTQLYRHKDAIYSVYPPTAFLTFAYWIYMVPPFKPKDMLMLGYAGGTVAGLVQQIYGDVPITGVDHEIRDNRYRVNLIKADVRDFVKISRVYDCVIVDLYDGLITPQFVADPDFVNDVCRITGDFLVIYASNDVDLGVYEQHLHRLRLMQFTHHKIGYFARGQRPYFP